MAKIFITGSADGLGQMAAILLDSQGHEVILHARNKERAKQAINKVPGAKDVLIADLSNLEETKQLAEKVNSTGDFDSIIHNAGVYQTSYEQIFRVNTLAPYILTCLIQKPKRLIYLSSSMHRHGNPDLQNLLTEDSGTSYSNSKLHDLILAKVVARKCSNVYSNAVDPGWVPTKMGGPGASDNLDKGFQTQAWLAVSNDNDAKVSGYYFYHRKQDDYLHVADDIDVQENFLSMCERITNISFPKS